MNADLSTAVHAERGLRALQDGDIAGAVGAFASISTDGWAMLAERFPGFPTHITSIAGAQAELSGQAIALPGPGAAINDEPDWTALGTRS